MAESKTEQWVSVLLPISNSDRKPKGAACCHGHTQYFSLKECILSHLFPYVSDFNPYNVPAIVLFRLKA